MDRAGLSAGEKGNGRQVLGGAFVLVFVRPPGPERIVVELNSLILHRAEDHRAETSVAERQGVGPFFSRPGITKIHESRCGGCHKAAEVSRADWIDIHRPQRSLFLAAPLAESAGGTAKCREVTYRDCEDEDYGRVLSLVEAAVEKAWKYPRRDLIALKDKWARQ